MKSIGWYLELIQISMGNLPQEVISEEGKKKGLEELEKIEGYTNGLNKILSNPKFDEILQRLKHVESLQMQEHEIEKLRDDLKETVDELNTYTQELRILIEKHPETWSHKAHMGTMIIYMRFKGERTELRKEFQYAVHTCEELKKLELDEEHLKDILRWHR